MLVWLLLAASPAAGQRLQGEWVDEASARVEAIRKVPVRVILLDADGRPAVGAAVRLEQVRHAMEIGVVVDEAMVAEAEASGAEGVAPPLTGEGAAAWACINSVSVGPLGRWRLDGVELGEGSASLERVLREADRRGWRVRWGGPPGGGLGGGVVSGDPAFNPDWASTLRGGDLWAAVETRLEAVLRAGGGRLAEVELLGEPLGEEVLTRRIGGGSVRRLFETAQANRPEAGYWLRYSDALSGDRGARLAASVVAAREGFVPFAGIVIEQRFRGPVVQAAVQRLMTRLERLEVPVVLEVSIEADTPLAEAVATEAVLRTLVASPVVRGVVFQQPARGGPLRGETGEMVARLFHGLWWSDDELLTDELGNARGRVFAGAYRITATLPNGQLASTRVWLPMSKEERLVVVQANRVESE